MTTAGAKPGDLTEGSVSITALNAPLLSGTATPVASSVCLALTQQGCVLPACR